MAVVLGSQPSLAGWSSDSATNVRITSTGHVPAPIFLVPDEKGGVIVAWAFAGIMAQHVTSSGALDPFWPAAGLVLAAPENGVRDLNMVADGQGGAFAVWYHNGPCGLGGCNEGGTLRAKHVMGNGTFDSRWPADGVEILNPPDLAFPSGPQLLVDGKGGVYVGCFQGSGSPYAGFVQHVLPSGGVDPTWSPEGVPIPVGGPLSLLADDSGGAIVAWLGPPCGVNAQRVAPSGVVDAAWPASGWCQGASLEDEIVDSGVKTKRSHEGSAPVTGSDQTALRRVADDKFAGAGFHLTMSDSKGGVYFATTFGYATPDLDVRVSHLTADGRRDLAWPTKGLPVTPASTSPSGVLICPDGQDGGLVAWGDAVTSSEGQLFVQHILVAGVVDPKWPSAGCPLRSPDNHSQVLSSMVPDGSGGAIAVWYGDGDVHAQHVTRNGAIDAAWPADGRTVCSAEGYQHDAVASADGRGGVIVSWIDPRAAFDLQRGDIYSQRVSRSGHLGPQGAEGLEQETASDIDGRAQLESSFALSSPLPNPTASGITMRIALPHATHVRLGIFDMTGRRVRGLAEGWREAGEYLLAWDLRDGAGSEASPGLYWACFEADGRRLAKHFVKL